MPHKDITVKEVDGAPSVASVDVIRVSNGTLTDDGSGQVTINMSGSGNVATDTIWDAKGDLAVATGADAASKLAVGTNGGILVADSGASSGIQWLTPLGAAVNTQEGTTSSTYTDLATSGPAVTVNISQSGQAIVIVSAYLTHNTISGYSKMGFAVSGASTLAASDGMALFHRFTASTDEENMSRASWVSGLTRGSNTFTAKYATSGGGTATFHVRHIIVIPL